MGLTGPLLSLWLSGKESIWNAGDLGLIPGLGGRLEKEMATNSSYSVLDTLHISSSFYSNLAKCAYLTFYTRGNGPCEVKLSEYVVQINWLADSNSVRF